MPFSVVLATTLVIFTACSTETETGGYDDSENLTSIQAVNYDQDRDTDTDITDSYRYQLPVVFHIFCMKGDNTIRTTLSPERMAFILSNVNDLWDGKYNSKSEDMDVDFVLATHNEEGYQLKYPGIDYINWSGDSIDANQLMNDKNSTYTKYVWDPNEYINVMVFPFKENDDETTTLGISDLPYTTKGDYALSGLTAIYQTTLLKKNLKFPYCSSINALYAGAAYDSKRYTATSDSERFNSSMVDISATLAHELGHYLGLHHVFTEKTLEEGQGEVADSCGDTDYCPDTPTYNKKEYDQWLVSYIQHHTSYYLTDMSRRNNCSGQNFYSSNLMDYAVSTSDCFSDNQRSRIRHVLYYSPLIPGPKKTSSSAAKTRSVEQGQLDLPITTRK